MTRYGRMECDSFPADRSPETVLPEIAVAKVREDAPFDDLITHTMPLDDINRAFDLMHAGESIRSVVQF